MHSYSLVTATMFLTHRTQSLQSKLLCSIFTLMCAQPFRVGSRASRLKQQLLDVLILVLKRQKKKSNLV